jgi:alpha-glucosidase
MDEYRVFTTDKERFPDLKKLVHELAQNNFKVVTIVDPGVKEDPHYKIFQEGAKEGLFCKTPKGKLFLGKVWPGMSAFPDFLKEQTREWWGKRLQFYTDMGIAGIWNDMNEPSLFGKQNPFAPEANHLPKEDDEYFVQEAEEGKVGHLEVRNLYGSMMCRATHDGLLALAPDQRPFVLTRSAYAGIQRYSAAWLGDNKSFFEHLANSLPMLLNMGLSGVAFAGVDIGGFGKDADSDLLIRWYELGIFYPFFRNHSMMGSKSQEPWAHSQFVTDNCRKLIETRYKLLPYIQNLFWQHQRDGAPLMRPLAWHYPDDKFACEIDDQFLFGQDILVAPIVRRGHKQRMVYFPEGLWHPFEGGEAIKGGKAQIVEFKLGSIPAFIRDGAIIPFADVMQSTVAYDQSPITFTCFGDNTSGVYFEDDGQSLDWQNGINNEWHLKAVKGTLTAQAVHKKYDAPKRKYFVSYQGKTTEVKI